MTNFLRASLRALERGSPEQLVNLPPLGRHKTPFLFRPPRLKQATNTCSVTLEAVAQSGRDHSRARAQINLRVRQPEQTCKRTFLSPLTVRHPLIKVDLVGLLQAYQQQYLGAMYSGCGGGYLYVIESRYVTTDNPYLKIDKVTLDGEVVVGLEPVFGYLHRGIEKLAETRTYTQVIPLTDRLDYSSGMSNNLAYCLAVEKLIGVEIPKRAQYIRVMLSELQRIAAHLLWISTHALDMGAMTVLFYGFRERENCLKVLETIAGAHRVKCSTSAAKIQLLNFEVSKMRTSR